MAYRVAHLSEHEIKKEKISALKKKHVLPADYFMSHP